jgi:acetyl-CoA carboxylase beta subunit
MAKKKTPKKEDDKLAISIGSGLCIGTVLGLLVFDNNVIGVSIGLVVGTAIGVALSHK